ncbi:MAG: PorP/SprF family type IX secretion system membrane protein [Lewinellaceae bacterium]|nr:PorP/SprF family type IX secretion system membrane protein [Lewinellaceae bacterium]
MPDQVQFSAVGRLPSIACRQLSAPESSPGQAAPPSTVRRPPSAIRPILAAALFFLSGQLFAQQLDLSTMYRYNWQVLNPAAVNHIYLEDKHKQYVANASYRQQWIGFEGAPATYNLRFEYFPKDTPVKVGGLATGDKAGAISTNSFLGNFAYLIYFSRRIHSESYLSVGLNVGGVLYRVDMNEIRFQDPNQPRPEGIWNQSYADMALGCFYRWKTYDPHFLPSPALAEFYIGLSVPQTFSMNLSRPEEGAFDIERVQHYYLITGGVFSLSRQLLLEPSLWVRYLPNASYQTLFKDTPVSSDLNCRLQYNNRFWAGVGASTNRLLHFEAGFNFGKGEYENDRKGHLITAGLAYDAPVGWNNWLGPSVEVSIGVGWE